MTTDYNPCAASLDSPALHEQRRGYQERFGGRVPWRVRVLETVQPDTIVMLDPHWSGAVLKRGDVVECWVNSYGAVSGICETGQNLGLLPDEYEVVQWHEQSQKP